MSTECNQFVFGFHPQKRRKIRAQFDGGAITSDGGGLLLREVEKRVGILRQFAACFTDYRNPNLIEHQVAEIVAQRVYGLALGYEDLNDHEELRNDPLLAVLVEKADPSRQVLAGKSTLNRLELTKETASRRSATKRSCWIMEPWTACWWRSFSKLMERSRKKSSWTWTRLTIRCTGSRKDVSSMATTDYVEKHICRLCLQRHSRHTYSTLLRSVGTEFKVMQELLRHSSLRSTLDVYTQAISPAKHAAQAAVLALVFDSEPSSPALAVKP